MLIYYFTPDCLAGKLLKKLSTKLFFSTFLADKKRIIFRSKSKCFLMQTSSLEKVRRINNDIIKQKNLLNRLFSS
jgi:hypothetical protein